MINIRYGNINEAALIAKFNQAMALETEDKVLDPDLINRGVLAVFDNPQLGFYLMAEVDGVPVGSLMITTEWSDWRNGLFWWIQSVYVDPEYRRQGVFRSLYNKVHAMAEEDPAVCGIRLYVEQDNENAQRTYTSLGMTETAYRLYEETFTSLP